MAFVRWTQVVRPPDVRSAGKFFDWVAIAILETARDLTVTKPFSCVTLFTTPRGKNRNIHKDMEGLNRGRVVPSS